MLAPQDANGVPQHAYYDKGVGGNWYDRIRGGVGGAGLSVNVQQVYQWLLERYEDGDDVFIFGFSRGAYTARSLAGLIKTCGLLRAGTAITPLQVYKRYRRGKGATSLQQIQFDHQYKKRELNPDEQELMKCSRRIKVKMIGVWDTVGALGIPWTEAPLIGRKNFYFHNTHLSVLFEHAYHALAIDEHRSPFSATLWTAFAPTGEPIGAPKEGQIVEQRWFAGSHCNVGGGYKNDELAEIPLAWIQDKATACGLAFRGRVMPSGRGALCEGRDSYADFIKGAWKIVKFGRRFYRPIGAGPSPVKGGMSAPINETIDASVFERYRGVPGYRPKNLEDWAKKRALNLATISGDKIA